MTIGLKCDGDTPRVASTQKQAFRNALDTDTFDRCLATGAAMDTAEAVRYAHTQIEAARSELHGAVDVPRPPASANSPSERTLRLVKGASAQR